MIIFWQVDITIWEGDINICQVVPGLFNFEFQAYFFIYQWLHKNSLSFVSKIPILVLKILITRITTHSDCANYIHAQAFYILGIILRSCGECISARKKIIAIAIWLCTKDKREVKHRTTNVNKGLYFFYLFFILEFLFNHCSIKVVFNFVDSEQHQPHIVRMPLRFLKELKCMNQYMPSIQDI